MTRRGRRKVGYFDVANLDAGDHDGLGRIAGKVARSADWNVGHLIDDVHSGEHAAEDGVAELRRRVPAVIELTVVRDVEVELRGRAAQLSASSHAQRAAQIAQPVRGLVQDRIACRLFGERFRIAAALDHKAAFDPVKHGALVEALAGVLQEVLDGNRRLVLEEFHGDVPLRGRYHRNRIAGRRFEGLGGAGGAAGLGGAV